MNRNLVVATGFLITMLYLAGCDGSTMTTDQTSGASTGTGKAVALQSSETARPASEQREPTGPQPFVAMSGVDMPMSPEQLVEGNSVVAQGVIASTYPSRYNTQDGNPPLPVTGASGTAEPQVGMMAYAPVKIDISRIFKNDTGSSIAGLLGLTFATGDGGNFPVMMQGGDVFKEGHEGIVFAIPLDQFWLAQPLGSDIVDSAAGIGCWPGEVNVWCQFEGLDAICRSVHIQMPIAELVDLID